ncbi:MAG TPA: DEAD/DEAH box helicase [Actinomycetota bacterium]|nr:DEAD/DEAH box helicase [Actinomycetota bacterium]
MPSHLERFRARYPFPLDGFQVTAIEALDAGESVLVAAPTGSGKTIVAEYAVDRALDGNRKAFYTTPLKALSNQKFGDFVARYGAGSVGLLTGDNSINSEAPLVVMTTEVLRNMLYERSSTLDGLQYVVMDEVHYLQDPYRGAVWEEVLIHLPLTVGVVCLSATVSNAEEFGEWIGTLRGPTRVVIEEQRPVPLEQHYLVGHELHPMHSEVDGHLVPNPYIVSLEQRELRQNVRYRPHSGTRQLTRHSRPREGHRRFYAPPREEVVEVLAEQGMLPAIYFVFSRAGCDRSVRWLLESGIRLNTRAESDRIKEFAEMRAAWMGDEDLGTLGFYEFREALGAGIAAHHAGMLPLFKETVEDLFKQGLVKVVFATETLSLGINMPAKSVVIDDVVKFQGERHEMLTPGEYTQLTGRAGRRGIDPVGHAVVTYQTRPDVTFERIASLASTRTYELTSSFRPSYNMAVNLIRNYSEEETHHLLNSSFAQFLADRGVVVQERELEHKKAFVAGYREQMECDLGDFFEYWGLIEKAQRIRDDARRGQRESRVSAVKEALGGLKPGDVVFVPTAKRRGLAAVVTNREGRPTVLTQSRRIIRLGPNDFEEPPEIVTRIPPPRGSIRSKRVQRDLAARMATIDHRPPKHRRDKIDQAAAKRARDLEEKAARHPCRQCPDLPRHERWAKRVSSLEREIAGLDRRIRSRTETVARQFDRVLRVLGELGYVEDYAIQPKGEMLARIYGEGDILMAECLGRGVFAELSPAEFAALVSTVVYEHRGRERAPISARLPTALTEDRYRRLTQTYRRIRRAEDQNGVELCREPDPGFATTIFHWAEGKPLEDVLIEMDMAPGDFVRSCKLLIDLLRQLEDVAGDEAADLARRARDAVNRSVVAYTGV